MSATDSHPDFADGTAGARKLIAIVYADMVGYSRLTGKDDGAPCAACDATAGTHRSGDRSVNTAATSSRPGATRC